MKREYRVKKHPEFDHIIKSGKKYKSERFTLYCETSPDQKHSRIGIAVGKKNGNAVVRNRLKRQVRAMVAKRNDYSLPLDVIILIRPSYSSEKFDENEAELLNALLELRINHIEN